MSISGLICMVDTSAMVHKYLTELVEMKLSVLFSMAYRQCLYLPLLLLPRLHHSCCCYLRSYSSGCSLIKRVVSGCSCSGRPYFCRFSARYSTTAIRTISLALVSVPAASTTPAVSAPALAAAAATAAPAALSSMLWSQEHR
jgi:hypothetical protein